MVKEAISSDNGPFTTEKNKPHNSIYYAEFGIYGQFHKNLL